MDRLVRQHQAGVWRYLRFLGCSPAEADDLLQETFLAVLRGSFEYRSPAQTCSYLRKVARNQLLMSVRQSRRGPKRLALQTAEEVWAATLGNSVGYGSAVSGNGDGGSAYLDALDECLAELAGRSRSAVELHYRDGASRKSIARQLGMTADGVKTLLRRTRAALRRCVERRVERKIAQ